MVEAQDEVWCRTCCSQYLDTILCLLKFSEGVNQIFKFLQHEARFMAFANKIDAHHPSPGRVKLVVGAVMFLPTYIQKQVWPEDYELCKAAQQYGLQIILSKDPRLRVILPDQGVSNADTGSHHQGLYQLSAIMSRLVLAIRCAESDDLNDDLSDVMNRRMQAGLSTVLNLLST